jgi:hypothetical protein
MKYNYIGVSGHFYYRNVLQVDFCLAGEVSLHLLTEQNSYGSLVEAAVCLVIKVMKWACTCSLMYVILT